MSRSDTMESRSGTIKRWKRRPCGRGGSQAPSEACQRQREGGGGQTGSGGSTSHDEAEVDVEVENGLELGANLGVGYLD